MIKFLKKLFGFGENESKRMEMENARFIEQIKSVKLDSRQSQLADDLEERLKRNERGSSSSPL